MSRQLKFMEQPKFQFDGEDNLYGDLVEINLNNQCTQAKQNSDQALNMLLQTPKHHGYPYGYNEVDPATEFYFCKKSKSTGQLSEKVASSVAPTATNISCLRQMYCPECHERLHEEGVRLERLLTMCCFALLPIYPCCMRRSNNDCKVICGKCGYTLGAWKRQ
ncbi:uncharacterized protein LOC26530107 [Drosophila willistoni]|uniref:uncharacterized protein LOC26530107 n=1 Tax=Drosophila willistoni TaxID=7260 RepID=UPI000C26C72B|nr:uncharacterized protein LOC26530107 [Drosophila willistoni]